MPFVLLRLNCFEKQLQRALKKHQKSIPYVDGVIDSLIDNRQQGAVYPGFNPLSVRKLRIGLPGEKIGKRGGLRLIFLTVPAKKKIVPLVVYRKKLFSSEHDVRIRISKALKAAENEL